MSLGVREELLLKLYDQLWNSINRQILVVWQSVSVVVGAFAVLTLVEKNIVPLDIAVSIILILSTWLIAHVYDASLWYNRNLAIIVNIEKQFLKISDLKEIHYFFKSHRPAQMIGHLTLQKYLGIGLSGIVLFYHFIERVYSGFSASWSNFEPLRISPYVVIVVAVIFLFRYRKKCISSYEKFIKDSPGADIKDPGIPSNGGSKEVKNS